MPLIPDILWVGRQRPVTGFGVQAVNNKLNIQFDVPISRIWESGLGEPIHSEQGFDHGDFAEAVEIARQHSKATPRIFKPVAESESNSEPLVLRGKSDGGSLSKADLRPATLWDKIIDLDHDAGSAYVHR